MPLRLTWEGDPSRRIERRFASPETGLALTMGIAEGDVERIFPRVARYP